VFFDGFKIATLVNALRLNATPAEGTLLTSLGESAQCCSGIARQDAQHGSQITVHERKAVTQQVLIIREYLFRASYIAGCSLDLECIRPQCNRYV